MIKVTIRVNTNMPTSIIVDANTTLRSALEQSGVDWSVGKPHLNGSALSSAELDRTFASSPDLGSNVYLSIMTAKDNA